MNWKSINGELPELGKKVLTNTTILGLFDNTYWGVGHIKEPSEACNGWSMMGITHWVDLPKFDNGNWVLINDKLPKDNTKCLVLKKNKEITVAIFWNKDYGKACNGWSQMDITHWMELPEQPK